VRLFHARTFVPSTDSSEFQVVTWNSDGWVMSGLASIPSDLLPLSTTSPGPPAKAPNHHLQVHHEEDLFTGQPASATADVGTNRGQDLTSLVSLQALPPPVPREMLIAEPP
jgi:hypothetical protein